MVLIILFTSIFSTISIIEDRREGFLQSVIVAPVARSSIVLGKILGGTMLSLLQGIILLSLTPFIGIHLTFFTTLLVSLVLFIISFGLTGLGFTIAWRMDSTQGFHAIMNLFLIPLWLLSGALFPSSGAASWLEQVMMVNPLSYGIASLRQALYLEGTNVTKELLPFTINLGITLAFSLVMFVISVLIVKKRQ
jgi:ABC-2 type transport system permease protein